MSGRTDTALSETNFSRVASLIGPIFDEASIGDRQHREALFLTFTFDPGFFETRLLGKVRAAGAAITVVADSGVFDPDPKMIRAAGRQYTLGVAAMTAAFHSKLTVLAGPQRALIGIGSGNLTTSGWHANDELLTTIRASRDDGVPTIVADVANFLHELPDHVTMGSQAADGVGRTADQLDDLIEHCAPVETGHRMLSTLSGPILDQLPTANVDHLRLSAPFHDPKGRALKALLERYRPSGVTILAQPGRAVMEPLVLARIARQCHCDLQFIQLEDDTGQRTPYRHAKLIEALVAGSPVWALTGSPNLTAAALLRPAAPRTGQVPEGNCEIAVWERTTTSLFPKPYVSVVDVAGLSKAIPPAIDPDADTATGGVSFLQACLVPGGLEVQISAPATDEVPVDISYFDSAPEEFEHLGFLPNGAARAAFPGSFPPTSRIRLLGQTLPLHDPELVVQRLRPTGTGTPNRDVTVPEIFGSDAVAAQWCEALTTLVTSQGHSGTGDTRAVAHAGEGSAHASWVGMDQPDQWGDYTDKAMTRLGLPIFQLAAGTSESPAVGAGLPSAAPAWEDHFETNDAEIYEEENETAEAADSETAEDHPELTPHQRSRLRAFVNELATLAPSLQPYERIAAVKLVIISTTTPIWDLKDPHGWAEPLQAALGTLGRSDWPSAIHDQAAAVAAVGLYRLRMAVPPDEKGRVGTQFRDRARDLRPLFSTAGAETVEANLAMLEGATLLVRTAEDVLSELDEATDRRGNVALLRVLSRVMPELEFRWDGRKKLFVTGTLTNPMAIAARIIGEASEAVTIAVEVHSHNGRWAVVARTPDKITTIEGGMAPPIFKTYRTEDLPYPLVVLTNPEAAQRHRISRPPWSKPDAVDLEVLQVAGVSWPGLAMGD